MCFGPIAIAFSIASALVVENHTACAWHDRCSDSLRRAMEFRLSQDMKESYMSIGMQRFASEGHFATYDPFARPAAPAGVFQLQCRCCGFEPEDVVGLGQVVALCFRSCNRALFKQIRSGTQIDVGAQERSLAMAAGNEDYLNYLAAKFNGKKNEFQPARLSGIFSA